MSGLRREHCGMTLNPGHLKLELALAGVELDASARMRPELTAAGEHCGRDAIELLLPEDVVVDAPIDGARHRSCDIAPYHLSCAEEQFILRRRAEQVEVRVIPAPQFYRNRTTQGALMRDIGTVFGSFIALSPVGGCGFSLHHGPCSLCAGSSQHPVSPPIAVADVVDTVRAAFAEGAVEFVLFGGGPVDSEDGGVTALEPYVRAVKRHFDTFVAIQVHPPRHNRWIDRTYAMGVDALCYSVEIYDAERLQRLCPGRIARIGRDRYYDALAHAAAIFPSGTVWSDLIVGIEPTAATMRGIDDLSRAGVLPVLSLAAPETGASTVAMPPMEEIARVFAHLFHAVRQTKINMGWVRDLSFAVTPFEARFFASEDARLSVTQQFYRSKLGGVTARNLARLRRRLRVRTVSDSFDSSHL